MAKVPVKLQRDAVLSEEDAAKLPPGQAHWWLRQESEFVRLPKRVRGDQPLDQTVQLEPGTYTLGVGPAYNGLREDIVVEGTAEAAPPAVVDKPKKLPKGSVAKQAADDIVVSGKTFVITGDLDAMEREAAKTWLVGLGAKVSTAVSAKTNYVLAGRDPGPKKLEKAAELGIRVITEAELRGALGLPDVAAAAPVEPREARKADGGDLLARFAARAELDKVDLSKAEKLVGPKHFADLGLHEHELWGISIGPRGGRYTVYIDLKDWPKYAMQCNCREWRPCTHAYALLLTATRHFVPPAPPPEGHEDEARYRPGFE